MSTIDATAPPALRAFIARFDAYCELANVEEGPAARALLGSSRAVQEFREGRDPGVRRIDRANDDLDRWASEAGISLPPREQWEQHAHGKETEAA